MFDEDEAAERKLALEQMGSDEEMEDGEEYEPWGGIQEETDNAGQQQENEMIEQQGSEETIDIPSTIPSPTSEEAPIVLMTKKEKKERARREREEKAKKGLISAASTISPAVTKPEVSSPVKVSTPATPIVMTVDESFDGKHRGFPNPHIQNRTAHIEHSFLRLIITPGIASSYGLND